jgi:hypothetical protein
MIIDGVIQTAEIATEESAEQFYREVVSWAHQCWQLHVLGNDIDLTEFKRRMNVDNIDYNQFMIDHAEKLEQNPTGDKLYMLRVMRVLYPETYTDPDQE